MTILVHCVTVDRQTVRVLTIVITSKSLTYLLQQKIINDKIIHHEITADLQNLRPFRLQDFSCHMISSPFGKLPKPETITIIRQNNVMKHSREKIAEKISFEI